MTAPASPPTGHVAQPRNGLGTTGFVLGLLAALFSVIPIIGMIAWPLAILGLVFGTLGILRAGRGVATNKGLSIAGTVLATIGLMICISWAVLSSAVVSTAVVDSAGQEKNNAGQGTDRIEKEMAQSVPPTQSDKQAPDAPPKLAFGEAHVWPGGEEVVISAPTKYTTNNPLILADNERGVAVDITIINNTGDEINPLSWDIAATHGGRTADMIVDDDGFAAAQIPAGDELTITRAFKVGLEPAELRISIAPNPLAENTVHYRGEF